MKALILCCGGSPEPLEFSIKNFDADIYYFLHSKESITTAESLVEKCSLNDNQFRLKLIDDHESLEDSYAKSREVIRELLKDNVEITVDFTGGTKPMVAGLVLAAIGEDCKYIYVGSENSEARDKQGMGIVQNGFESIKDQRDPYEVYAVMEFNKGMDFFNKYQFTAAKSNFEEASEKLENKNLKELSELYLNLVDVYDRWDKFKNVKGKKITLNYILKNIINEINSSSYLSTYINDNFPDFISQIKNNIEFLDLKLSSKGKIKSHNVPYYLPDLLNNAYRRIEEGKYDDAVARLYRSTELIAQISLTKENLINESNLEKNSEFSINIIDVESLYNLEVDNVLSTFNDYNKSKQKGKKTFRIGLKNNYQLLDAIGLGFANDYLCDNEISRNITFRNRSILAHGLQPVDEKIALELYTQVLNYAKEAFPDVEKYMEMSKFPKFE